MIVFDLACDEGHRFEGWFGSSDDYRAQQARGLLDCPQCGSRDVSKAPMAPSVPRKGNRMPAERAPKQGVTRGEMPAEVAAALTALAAAQAKALENSTWVGEAFSEQTRAMHYGERAHATIHGKASADEARELLAEGIAVAPLPFPITPPDELN
ncbi:MAG: DUF1178 family protein [Croceibacterium sp.]